MPTRMKRGGGIPTYLYNMAIKGEREKRKENFRITILDTGSVWEAGVNTRFFISFRSEKNGN